MLFEGAKKYPQLILIPEVFQESRRHKLGSICSMYFPNELPFIYFYGSKQKHDFTQSIYRPTCREHTCSQSYCQMKSMKPVKTILKTKLVVPSAINDN